MVGIAPGVAVSPPARPPPKPMLQQLASTASCKQRDLTPDLHRNAAGHHQRDGPDRRHEMQGGGARNRGKAMPASADTTALPQR